MSAQICILGAGTGGTLTANRLRKEVPDAFITVVDENDRHVYQPGLLRAEGIETNLFFTFFGLDAVHKKRIEHIKVATVGNPGMHMATLVGALPVGEFYEQAAGGQIIFT